MPRLLLLRHAKSSWDDPGLPDRDRPLTPRGRRAAGRIASVLAAAEFLPDLVLCSPALRTRETLAPLLPLLADPDRVSIVDALYGAESGDYRKVIAGLGGSAGHLLVIGHNPAIHGTALNLIGPSAHDKSAYQLAAKFPTGALAVIDFDTSNWGKIRSKSGRLATFIRPRDLEESTDFPDDD
jgi:phosphohistidine phosphatase